MSLLLNKNFIFGVLIVSVISALYFYVYSLKTDIKDLQLQVSQMEITVINKKLEVERLETSIISQNKYIESLEANKTKNLAELEKWKNKPAEVRYKTIYETIYKDKEIKSNECKDIKTMLDNVRSIDFSSL